MDILKGENSAEAIGKAIAANFSNAEELVKSEAQVELEGRIQKGELEVITAEDITKSHGGVFYTSENVEKAQADITELIEKGEETPIEAEDFEKLEKAQNEINDLKEVIIKGEHEGEAFLVKAFISPAVEATPEGETE